MISTDYRTGLRFGRIELPPGLDSCVAVVLRSLRASWPRDLASYTMRPLNAHNEWKLLPSLIAIAPSMATAATLEGIADL